MKVTIAGGTGFIGSALVHALWERGDEVTLLARNPTRAPQQYGPAVRAVEWHPPRSGPWMEAVDGADAVVNLAGAPILPTSPLKAITERWTDARKAEILASRIDPTVALIEAISRASVRPRVLVNGSAIGYYGSRGAQVITEADDPGNDFPARVCVDWEAGARAAEALDVRLCLLRTAIVLGQDGGALPMMVLPFKLFMGGTEGRPDQWLSWIHIEDEVRLILYLLDQPEVHGPVNAAAPNPVTMQTFCRQIGGVLRRPSWVPFMDRGLKLAMGEESDALLTSQRVIPAAATAAGFEFRHPDSEKALRAILRPQGQSASNRG